ncbi:hypothetical protein [Aquimarina sp. MMG016]|uniref:hypothetical protein n=1 Tax=Aquimarina sp. MMG016 TaxID=2822690 RepID=UPI001B39D9C1|nr:hypothetical protein [Aquimarina sp. MMG016]MBQ4819688.1 hypothetical protein [Aquimarina sp. MMG016]
MKNNKIIKWLLEGDVSVQYQVHRDLLSKERKDLQNRISKEGFGAKFLSKRHEEGHWGKTFYQPKWTSSHYTLLDLRNLCISPNNQLIKDSIEIILQNEKANDGGISPFGLNQLSDLCVNGMFLNYASYFKANEYDLRSVIDCILTQIMPDGGFNCRSNRFQTVHSSLHTTISVLEGIAEYEIQGYTYRLGELKQVKKSSTEFILLHRLFLSDRTGEIINKNFLKLTYPSRWRYNILRALDHFQHSKVQWDDRMNPAIQVLQKKRKKNSTWNVQSKHPGKVHFEMEKAGKPSRWNTLKALRVLKYYKIEKYRWILKVI